MNGLPGLPLPAAICAMLRPEAIERSCFSSASPALRAYWSACLIRSQLVRLPPARSRFMRTSTHSPFSRPPSSRNFRFPAASAARAFVPGNGAHRPRSQSWTVPPPYSPCGIVPSKSP